MSNRRFTIEREREIVTEYIGGKTIPYLNKKYDCSNVQIMLKRHGIKTRPKDSYRHYKIDQSFFDLIDTEAKAYFLGFMYADGNNGKRNHICLKLQSRDLHILKTFRKCLGYTGKIRDVWCKGRCYKQLDFKSKHLSQRLVKIGCPRNKSFKIKFPSFLPQKLLPHFIRGYFDGDGSIYICKLQKRKDTGASYRQNGFKILGTPHFLHGCKKIFEKELGIHCYIIRMHNIPSLKSYNRVKSLYVYGTIQILCVMAWLYAHSTFYLKRKRLVYDRMVKKQKENRSWKLSAEDKDKIKRDYLRGESAISLSKEYGVRGHGTITSILKRRNVGIRDGEMAK